MMMRSGGEEEGLMSECKKHRFGFCELWETDSYEPEKRSYRHGIFINGEHRGMAQSLKDFNCEKTGHGYKWSLKDEWYEYEIWYHDFTPLGKDDYNHTLYGAKRSMNRDTDWSFYPIGVILLSQIINFINEENNHGN